MVFLKHDVVFKSMKNFTEFQQLYRKNNNATEQFEMRKKNRRKYIMIK